MSGIIPFASLAPGHRYHITRPTINPEFGTTHTFVQYINHPNGVHRSAEFRSNKGSMTAFRNNDGWEYETEEAALARKLRTSAMHRRAAALMGRKGRNNARTIKMNTISINGKTGGRRRRQTRTRR
jgi:hypothetical protein